MFFARTLTIINILTLNFAGPAAPTMRTPHPGPQLQAPVWSRCPAALMALALVLVLEEGEKSAVHLCPVTNRAQRPA